MRAITSAQNVQKGLADHGELVDVLMAIDIIRRLIERHLEGIQLLVDLLPDQLRIEPPCPARHDQTTQRQMEIVVAESLGQVKMHPLVDGKTPKMARRAREEAPPAQATHRRQTSARSEFENAGIDTGPHTEIVGADHDRPVGRRTRSDAGHLFHRVAMRSFVRQVVCFVAVGCAAAATHWVTAVVGIAYVQYPPFLANFIGWLVALVVSFSGHYRLTFRYQTRSFGRALRRFSALSFAGFAINELAFVTLLQITDIPYYGLLALILLSVAALTFVLSRYWAFRHKS